MEGKRRLGALVRVQVVFAEAVAAAAGREVVERPVEPVAAQEPVERSLGAGAVLGLARDENAASSASTNADASSGCSSPSPGRGLVAMAPLVAGKPQHAVREPALVTEPGERLEPGRDVRLSPRAVPPTISACERRALS